MSASSLTKVAIIGGAIALGGGGYFSWRIQANFESQEYYKKSLELLKGYPPALRLLGEPIRTKRLDLGDTESTWTDGFQAKIAIPLRGKKEKGTLHAWASRKTVQERWEVDKLDLEVNSRQWTFYVNPKVKDLIKLTQQADDPPKDHNARLETLQNDEKTTSDNLLYVNTR